MSSKIASAVREHMRKKINVQIDWQDFYMNGDMFVTKFRTPSSFPITR